MSLDSAVKFVLVDKDLYPKAGEIIKSVFIPENAVGVDLSFKLSTTPRGAWGDICRDADAKHGTDFAAQFAPISKLQYFVMMDGNRPVGVSGMYSLKGEENEAWVGWLGVAEDAQGRGYGKKVLEHVVGLARSQGCDTLRLWSENYPEFETAHSMYYKRGFRFERSVVGMPEADRQSTYKILSLNLANETIPATEWPTSSLKKFGLAGGIGPYQIVADGEEDVAPKPRESMELTTGQNVMRLER